MSMASATGGLTSRAVRTVRRTTLTQSAPRDPDSLHSPRPARRDGAGRGPWGRAAATATASAFAARPGNGQADFTESA